MAELEPPVVPDRPFFRWVQQNKVFDRMRRVLRGVRPWKDKSMNVYDVGRFFFLGLVNGSVSTRAAAISFRLFVAFFPAMIFLLSIIPYTPQAHGRIGWYFASCPLACCWCCRSCWCWRSS